VQCETLRESMLCEFQRQFSVWNVKQLVCSCSPGLECQSASGNMSGPSGWRETDAAGGTKVKSSKSNIVNWDRATKR